jgi:ABC-type transport system involved in multi-copper enzyme maturation permease subunit
VSEVRDVEGRMTLSVTSRAGRSRSWRWSNSRRSWEERLGVLAILLLGAGIYWFGSRVPRSQQVVLWALFVLGVMLVLRRGWVKLFGPLLFYELVRLARRGRQALFRCLYGLVLLLILYLVYSEIETRAVRGRGRLPAHEMAALGESFFTAFMVTQFLAVGLLTPVYVGGAVCDEKERRTLGFLLATDLRNREIVLSKLASRLANLCLLVLTSLPILSFTEFLGGVDPDLVLGGFAATALMMLSVGSLSILCSVYSRRARAAIPLVYGLVAFYLAASTVLMVLMFVSPGVATRQFPLTSLTIQHLVNGLNAGNPIFALVELVRRVGSGTPLADAFPDLLRDYALFHVPVAILCCTLAIVRLRAVFLHEVSGPRRKRIRTAWRWGRRPPVGNQPMLWKEMFGGSRMSVDWLGRIALALLVGGSFAPAAWIGYYAYSEPLGIGEAFPAWMNGYVRGAGTVVACVCLLAIALRASSSVTGERERQTWESVLVTPLESKAILFGKWLGVILSMRWAGLWLAAIWTLGLVFGALSIFAVPLLAAACLVYAGFLSSLGLWFSMVSRSSLRANMGTLVATGFLAGGYWVFLFGVVFNRGFSETFRLSVGAAITPPLSLGILAFPTEEFAFNVGEIRKLVAFAMIGLAGWAAGTVLLWFLASARFRSMTGRRIGIPPQVSAKHPSPVDSPIL